MNSLDKKVLQELTINSRQSYKQIAKKINSKKDSVAYSIKKLEQKGIISKYVPIFSLNKLNFFTVKMYLNLKGLNNENEKNILNWLKNNKKIVWVAKSVGTWNLMIGLNLNSLHHFANEKRLILNKIGKFVSNYTISFIEDAYSFDRRYLFKTIKPRKEFVYGGNIDHIKLNKKELELIQLIKNNARFEYANISKKLNIDARTIKHKLDLLKQKGILQGYTTFLNINKIGYQLHKLCIYLNSFDKKSEEMITEYLKINPNTIHLIKCVGDWELEVEIEHNNIIKIHEYIAELRNKFPEVIKQIDLITITKEEKLDFFPNINN